MPSYEDYTVAVICALEFEMTAVRFMLDEEHGELPNKYGDSNSYILGVLNGHRIALAWLPGTQGKGAAAVVATNLNRTFPSIKWRFLVGIGGGVPHGEKHDIRLGDVVDPDENGKGGFHRKGYLAQTPTLLRGAAGRMRSDHDAFGSQAEEIIATMLQRWPRLKTKYKRPAAETDILFEADYPHQQNMPTCVDCDKLRAVPRLSRDSECPEIHYGLIASGDRVMRSAAKRAEELGRVGEDILCFEMEAAGMMTEFSGLVIRGVSDYADSHKNDDWQRYAAAAAAACLKELLLRVQPEKPRQDSASGRPSPLAIEPSSSQSHSVSTLSGQGVVNSGSGNFGVGRDLTFPNR
ncbi:hypothetical protein PG988_016196 [Apiospora saccharicola]